MSLAEMQLKVTRNEEGIDKAIASLSAKFGDRCQTSKSLREQHGHTTSWLPNQPPDAVVFAQSTAEVSEIVKICADLRVPIIIRERVVSGRASERTGWWDFSGSFPDE